MPNLTLEYTANLSDFDAVKNLASLNQYLIETGLFKEIEIKSRAIALHDFRIGGSAQNSAFVHATLSILRGRSVETRRELSEGLLQTLASHNDWSATISTQLRTEIREIDQDTYCGLTVGSAHIANTIRS
ncbi:5-carboxymethyl-2-hydroxymuconate Delta-isomerase [Chitinibacter sp. SCUT-21]|uniref:5-carboxymethyl-2-hydroxymuconate Delta-isomerase n=1 Tax=Chitinibacter sp. SCUT-21 TaxID=2970891 RepID=UPI0035A6FAD9